MARALIRIGRLRVTGASRLRLPIKSVNVRLGVAKRQAGAPSVSAEVFIHQGC